MSNLENTMTSFFRTPSIGYIEPVWMKLLYSSMYFVCVQIFISSLNRLDRLVFESGVCVCSAFFSSDSNWYETNDADYSIKQGQEKPRLSGHGLLHVCLCPLSRTHPNRVFVLGLRTRTFFRVFLAFYFDNGLSNSCTLALNNISLYFLFVPMQVIQMQPLRKYNGEFYYLQRFAITKYLVYITHKAIYSKVFLSDC